MYSVMKNQNGCYIKMSSHAMSSFHVLRLSKNAKVPIPFLISFRHCYANSDILILFVFVYFICLKALNAIFVFSALGVDKLIVHHVFNFQCISRRKVNYTQISYEWSRIAALIHCFKYTYFNPFSTNVLNYYLSFCAIAYVGKQHFLWSRAICCMLSLQKKWHLEC